MYLILQNQLAQRVRALLREKYQLEIENIAIAQPPSIALGEYALPLAMELAKKLRQPPRKIAEEIVGALGGLPGSHSAAGALRAAVSPHRPSEALSGFFSNYIVLAGASLRNRTVDLLLTMDSQ